MLETRAQEPVVMAGITLPIATAKLQSALDAHEKALNSVSYGKSGGQINVNVQHQPIDKLEKTIDYWQGWIDKLTDNSQGIIISQIAPK